MPSCHCRSTVNSLSAATTDLQLLTPTPMLHHRFRYIASLRPTDNKSSHFCGATLIHPRVVLTAAHVSTSMMGGCAYVFQ